MEPLCRVIEGIEQELLRFKEKPFRSGAFNLRATVSLFPVFSGVFYNFYVFYI
jgi:hypothetical protein